MFGKLLLTDSDGNKSTTLTAFVLGFAVVNLKLLISGLTLGGYQMSTFSGVDYSAALAALGAIYVMRRSTNPNLKQQSEGKEE